MTCFLYHRKCIWLQHHYIRRLAARPSGPRTHLAIIMCKIHSTPFGVQVERALGHVDRQHLVAAPTSRVQVSSRAQANLWTSICQSHRTLTAIPQMSQRGLFPTKHRGGLGRSQVSTLDSQPVALSILVGVHACLQHLVIAVRDSCRQLPD